jgi:hypothetical protein
VICADGVVDDGRELLDSAEGLMARADAVRVNEKKVRSRVRPALPPGETYAAAVQLHAGLVIAIGTMPLRIPLRPRVLVVTDRNTHLFTGSWFSACKPKERIATLAPGAIIQPRRQHFQLEIEVEILGKAHWTSLAWRNELQRVVEASQELAAEGWKRSAWG